MKPIELLMKEHEVIRQMLKIMKAICDNLKPGSQVDTFHLNQIVKNIRNFADKCYNRKEEHILFETMGKTGFSKQVDLIGVMPSEHETGREFILSICHAIEIYEDEDKSALSSIVGNAMKYSFLVDQHIENENKILYPMAVAHLSIEEQIKLFEEFEKFDQQRIVINNREEFNTILKNLSNIYLN